MSDLNNSLSVKERNLIKSHLEFYRSLDNGERIPSTKKQRHFVAVCHGKSAPETEHEWAYMNYKILVHKGENSKQNQSENGPDSPDFDSKNADFVSSVVDVPVRPCASCNTPISPSRLIAKPEAQLCIECKGRQEKNKVNPEVSEKLCPRCKTRGIESHMVWRTPNDPNKYKISYFLGCSRFPECKYTI